MIFSKWCTFKALTLLCRAGSLHSSVLGTNCLSSLLNWVPPTPQPSVATPGGGGLSHSLAGGGGGAGDQFRRLDRHCGPLYSNPFTITPHPPLLAGEVRTQFRRLNRHCGTLYSKYHYAYNPSHLAWGGGGPNSNDWTDTVVLYIVRSAYKLRARRTVCKSVFFQTT